MKPTIEEALKSKLPLPWKKKFTDGATAWIVSRQRPDSLTFELYRRLREYGLKDTEIRELFYVMPGAWSKMKNELGIMTPVGKPKEKVAAFEDSQPGPSRLAQTPAKELPKVSFGSSLEEQRAQGVRDNVESFIKNREDMAESTVLDLSGWESFELSKSYVRPRSLIAGSKKIYVGVGVKFIADWDRCRVKVRPDGKQIALEKASGTGYKVGRDHQRPAITCRAATEMLKKTVGTGKEFEPIIEQESLLVFAAKETAT